LSRDIPIGNGSYHVAFDSSYRIADIYFPHVGMENHLGSRFRFGVWADDALSWVEDEEWTRSLGYLRETLVTDVTCHNDSRALSLHCYDAIDTGANTFVRKIVVRNLRDEARSVKLFFHHDFALYGNAVGDTAMYDAESQSLIHYKASRYFLINAHSGNSSGIPEYACGRSGITATEGAWRDAEDGVLSMSAIAQGAVDSVAAIPVDLEPLGSATVFYWICAGKRYGEVRALDAAILAEGPSKVIARTASYWYTWANRLREDLSTDLPEELIDLYQRSLLVVRTQCDRGGAIIAANDSDIQWLHHDHYSYCWPRDGAFVADAMDRAGYHEIARSFLEFCERVIKNDGYFLHKYNPDGTLASLWHAWVRNGKPRLPIQEDETALVVWLLWRYYDRMRDLDFVRGVYERLAVHPAEFMLRHRDPVTKLPLPSFDLWEEREGVFTFTAAAVVAGLRAASGLANLFNDQERRTRYARGAAEVRAAMMKHLWLDDEQRFARGLLLDDDGTLVLDRTLDASVAATFLLDVFDSSSVMVEGTVAAIRQTLWVQTEVGGIARYPGDTYQKVSEEIDRVPGNPWLTCTLWLAEHAVRIAETPAALQSALDLLRWARANARPSLLLPEQLHPYNGEGRGVAPFTWAHAQVVSVVRGYIERLAHLRRHGHEKVQANSVENSTAESD
jgi:GH15 family glucan-1,4-alpha-glucosidase